MSREAALRFSASCCVVRAPKITDVTAGCAASHASETSAALTPRDLATAVTASMICQVRSSAFRGLNEVVEILVRRGAYIDARDYRGRTPYRLAEGSKQSFQFQGYPATAEFIRKLGANTRLSIPGTEHERIRDVGAAIAAADQP